MSAKRILVIAGSDSSGGAGLEADQKVIAAFGCYAMTATTALTAQNTLGVYDIHQIPPSFVSRQIDACADDIGVDVVKTGMLASEGTINVVANAIHKHNFQRTVVDPVMVSTTGSQLLPESAVNTLIRELLPMTTILTPNLPEAKLLLQQSGKDGGDPVTVDDFVRMAKSIQTLGPKYVLLKGGHSPLAETRQVAIEDEEKSIILTVLVGGDDTVFLESPYLRSSNTHGTGCSLASIASNLALGMSMHRAVRSATRYVEAGIKYSVQIGRGSGPINHFHSSCSLKFSPGNFVEYLFDRDDVRAAWKEFAEHEFVKGLASGNLSSERFKNFLIQDYLFLIHYSRAHALAAFKANNFNNIGKSTKIVARLQEEVKLHISYCAGFDITTEEIMASEESQECMAYTRYILDIGQSQDWLALQVALLPCLLGYGMIAKDLFNDPKTLRESNKYWSWILTYVGEDYKEAMRTGAELVEEHVMKQSPSRIEEFVGIFLRVLKLEKSFWDA